MSANPSPPPVFVPQGTPRRLRFGTAFGALGVVGLVLGFFLVLLCGGITAAFLSEGPFWEDRALDARGARASATADGAERTGTRINNERVWEVRVHFPDEQGIPHSASFRTRDEAVIDAAREGRRLPIEYLPGRPQVVRPEGARRSPFGLFALLPALGALAGLLVVALTLRGWARRRRIYRWGAVAVGRVVSVTDSNITVNGRRLLRIRYTFAGPAGPVEATVNNATAPPEGAEVSVLFDPDRPERNLLPVPGTYD